MLNINVTSVFLSRCNAKQTNRCKELYHFPPGVFGGCSWSRFPRWRSPEECYRWRPAAEHSPRPSAQKTQTNWVLAGAIHQTWIDDKVGTIILASQRRIPEQNHGDINRQYSELKNSLDNCPGGGGSEGVGYRYLGSSGWACVTRLMCVYSTRTLPEQSSVIAWDNMGGLPSGSFNDCYCDDGTVVGHNMVMIDCFPLEELYCTHFVKKKMLQCFTSRAEMFTKCTHELSFSPFQFFTIRSLGTKSNIHPFQVAIVSIQPINCFLLFDLTIKDKAV